MLPPWHWTSDKKVRNQIRCILQKHRVGHACAVDIRVEADVKHTMATPKTVDEALAELESKVGAKGRKKFERFFREVAEDEDEDVIDVESK